MKTVTIDILNEKVMSLLKELEALNLIKMLNAKSETPTDKKKASDYKGIIPPEVSDKMQEHIRQSREEWQHRI